MWPWSCLSAVDFLSAAICHSTLSITSLMAFSSSVWTVWSTAWTGHDRFCLMSSSICHESQAFYNSATSLIFIYFFQQKCRYSSSSNENFLWFSLFNDFKLNKFVFWTKRAIWICKLCFLKTIFWHIIDRMINQFIKELMEGFINNLNHN